MDLDAVALRHGQARFRLEERDLDRLRVERRLDDVRGGRQRRVHVAARERGGRLQHVRRPRREGVRRMHERRARLQRLERIGDRLEHLVVDFDLRRGLARVELRVGDDHREEVGDAAGQLAFGDEHRLIGIVEAGAADRRHVRRREDAHDAGHRRRLVGVNLQHPRARMLGQHHRAVQHAGHAHVVDERLLAERLLERRPGARPNGRSRASSRARCRCRSRTPGCGVSPNSSPKIGVPPRLAARQLPAVRCTPRRPSGSRR